MISKSSSKKEKKVFKKNQLKLLFKFSKNFMNFPLRKILLTF